MRGRSLALALLVAAGPAVGACSDDGGDGNAQPYIDALTESFLDSEEGEFAPTEEQAECMAEKTVDAIGADTLEDEGITPEDVVDSDGPEDLGLELSEDQATEAARAFFDCDLSFAEAFAGADAADEAVECIDENLDEDRMVEAIAAQYQGDEEEADEIFGELFTDLSTECEEAFAG
jgi:hypothetical protein